jgi:hypothetical protein
MNKIIFEELIYELQVYLEKINKLVELNLCPYFVCAVGYLNVAYNEYIDFIKKSDTDVDRMENYITDYVIQNNSTNDDYINTTIDNHLKTEIHVKYFLPLLANINAKQIKNTNNDHLRLYTRPDIHLPHEDLTFGYTLTEKVNGFPIYELMPNMTENDFKTVIFQILIACYAMFLSGVSHNDLHVHNVFIMEYSHEITTKYYINGKVYEFKSKYGIKIYDFDRGYIRDFKNYFNERQCFRDISYSNHVLDPRDFVIAICNVLFELENTFNEIFDPESQSLKFNRDDMIKYIKENCSTDSNNTDIFKFKGCRPTMDDTGNIIGNNTKSDFTKFNKYEVLIEKFGKSFVTTDKNDVNYFLDKDFFDNNTINMNKLLYKVLYKEKINYLDIVQSNRKNICNPDQKSSSICSTQNTNSIPRSLSNFSKIDSFTRILSNKRKRLSSSKQISCELKDEESIKDDRLKKENLLRSLSDDNQEEKKSDQNGGGQNDYKQKYLKYKLKYLNLKNLNI